MVLFWAILIFILALVVAFFITYLENSKDTKKKIDDMQQQYDGQLKDINEKLKTLEDQLNEMKKR